MKKATFRIIKFPKLDRYIGLAWNYEEAVLIGTEDFESYTKARHRLDELCSERNVTLQWFDGEYLYDDKSGQLMELPGDEDRKEVLR